MRSGDICLFSPVSGLSDAAKASLADIGEVVFLLAPNGYHNGGLVQYAKAYPVAVTVASPAVHKRLHDSTGLTFDGLETLRAALPGGMRLECPAGLKNGETWLIVQSSERCLWHVVDAFGAQKNSEGKVGNKIRANKVFSNFGIWDRLEYYASLKKLIVSDPPDILLPCHGAIVIAANLTEQMREIHLELNEV